jgi:hypothetical protein
MPKMQAPPGYQWVRIRDMTPTEIITDGCDCYPWHEVYAWLPVRTVSGKIVWGKKVFKRKVWMVWGSGFHMEPETQYATAFDLIKEPL